jgi:hypothetical protein
MKSAIDRLKEACWLIQSVLPEADVDPRDTTVTLTLRTVRDLAVLDRTVLHSAAPDDVVVSEQLRQPDGRSRYELCGLKLTLETTQRIFTQGCIGEFRGMKIYEGRCAPGVIEFRGRDGRVLGSIDTRGA